MILKKIIIVSLLLLISASSFFLPAYFDSLQKSDNISISLLEYGVKIENIAAMRLALYKEPKGTKPWVDLLILMAKKDAVSAYELGRYYKSVKNINQALLWFKQGVRLNNNNAYFELANLYFEQEHDQKNALELAALTLEELVLKQGEYSQYEYDAQLIKKLSLQVKIALKQGNTKFLNDVISKHLNLLLQNKQGVALMSALESFNVDHYYKNQLKHKITNHKLRSTNTSFELKSNISGSSCIADIQFFATNLKDLNHVQSLIETFAITDLGQRICLLPVRYVPLTALQCDNPHLNTRQKALACDESYWHTIASTIPTKFIGVVVPYTNSYVNLGILYLKPKETISGFSHEVSHLMGFVDEYPIPLRHEKCQQIQSFPFSLNVAVLSNLYQGDLKALREQVLQQVSWRDEIKATTPIFVKEENNELNTLKKEGNVSIWRLGTPMRFKHEIGVFSANTCDNNEGNKVYEAYRPTAQTTSLQYAEIPFSTLYLRLLNKQPKFFQMPSFEYNIALSYYLKGNIRQARLWLKKAAEHEKNPLKKSKIEKGLF